MSPVRLVLFLAVVGTVTASLHYYLWARLVRDMAWPPSVHTGLTWTLASLAILLPTSLVLARTVPRAIISPWMWVIFTWLGLMFLLVVLLLPGELVRVLAWFRHQEGGPIDGERRQFLARLLGGAAGLGGIMLAGIGLREATRQVAIKPVSIVLPRLPAAFANFRIVQLTDIHVGPTIGRNFIESLVTRTNALQPDLIAITGDLVDGSVAELGRLVAPLGQLRARHGVYFVTGNHEYYSGADAWVAYLRELGITVLRNERVTLERDGECLDIAGVDDPSGHNFAGHGADLPAALAGREPGRPVVLLAHQPRAANEAAELDVDLQLSGHTHGGQIFPFNLLVKLQQPFVAGLHRLRNLSIYVSTGTGYWGPPMRLGIPAEISDITLHTA